MLNSKIARKSEQVVFQIWGWYLKKMYISKIKGAKNEYLTYTANLRKCIYLVKKRKENEGKM